MADQKVNFSEVLLADLDGMIIKLSASIGEAQRQLDLAALRSQATLQQDYKELADIGYRVPWYVIPEVSVEVKVAVHFEEKTQEDGSKKSGWFFSPFNAKYQNAYSFVADGTSTVKLRIVPLPPSTVDTPTS